MQCYETQFLVSVYGDIFPRWSFNSADSFNFKIKDSVSSFIILNDEKKEVSMSEKCIKPTACTREQHRRIGALDEASSGVPATQVGLPAAAQPDVAFEPVQVAEAPLAQPGESAPARVPPPGPSHCL